MFKSVTAVSREPDTNFYFSLLSVAVRKTSLQKATWGRKCLLLTCLDHSLSLWEANARAHGRNPETGSGVEAMGENCF